MARARVRGGPERHAHVVRYGLSGSQPLGSDQVLQARQGGSADRRQVGPRGGPHRRRRPGRPGGAVGDRTPDLLTASPKRGCRKAHDAEHLPPETPEADAKPQEGPPETGQGGPGPDALEEVLAGALEGTRRAVIGGRGRRHGRLPWITRRRPAGSRRWRDQPAAEPCITGSTPARTNESRRAP